MNQSQFVDEIMTIVFGEEYEYMSDEDCSYELAIGMIKQKYEEKKVYSRRPSLRETQAMQAYNRGGY
tara:strand:- start:248 stop:448 length:201 start_codon:yes stop_codon:yes gene_type:complete